MQYVLAYIEIGKLLFRLAWSVAFRTNELCDVRLYISAVDRLRNFITTLNMQLISTVSCNNLNYYVVISEIY